ncbi:MAG: hypothetical protein OEY03_15425 [Rhizobacter sp.]|nr:hypothetical protein [Rhizobacter sp.]
MSMRTLPRGAARLRGAVAIPVGADGAGDVAGPVLRRHRRIEQQHLIAVLLQPGRVDQVAGTAGFGGGGRVRGEDCDCHKASDDGGRAA